MYDDDGKGQIGCFVDFLFILAVIVIFYLVVSDTTYDKTKFIFFILVAYFIRKVLRENLPKF